MDHVTNIVIRTDASRTIGHGHVMRCVTLANALREHGAAVSFVCREQDGHLCNLIAQRGFTVSRLPAPNPGTQTEGSPAHAAWLGSSWQDDAWQTIAAIESMGTKPDWLVVDHYALDSRWESVMRTSTGQIMVIDDLADRVHDCDLLLDQNLVAQMQTRYADKVPASCTKLLGPEYALLQPIYAELHDRITPRKGPIWRIFIFFGGADNENLTGRTLAAFLALNRQDIEVDVVIADGSTHVQSIRRQIAGNSNIHLHTDLPTLAPLMAKSDLAIGAGGATSWERLCLGLYTLVVTLAEHQRPVALELANLGVINWLGHKDEVSEQTIRQALSESINARSLQPRLKPCPTIADGHGVDRVCNHLCGISAEPRAVRQLGDVSN